jgi:hypothetical protein
VHDSLGRLAFASSGLRATVAAAVTAGVHAAGG